MSSSPQKLSVVKPGFKSISLIWGSRLGLNQRGSVEKQRPKGIFLVDEFHEKRDTKGVRLVRDTCNMVL